MKAVIITGNKYPLEDAGALRQHSIAKLFQMLKYDALVLGYGKPTYGKIKVFDGIEYVSFRPSCNNVFIRAFYRYIFIDRVVRFLKKNIRNVDVILVVDVLPKDFKKIEKLAVYYNAELIHDSVEWYSPEEFPEGERNRSYRNKEYTNNVAISSSWRVIAISKFLENHFLNKCSVVTRIPVIIDVLSIKPVLSCLNNKVVFVYAGGPGKKDYLKTILDGFLKLDAAEKELVEFHIIGVNKDQLISLCSVDSCVIDSLNSLLTIHGRLSHAEAVSFVKNASYTILIRDETLRYSKAGFPTKVVESLAYGTPVLCNLTSDLNDYLVDSENSIIAGGHQPDDVARAIRTAIKIDNDSYFEMRKNARKTAETYFDYRKYVDSLLNLLTL